MVKIRYGSRQIEYIIKTSKRKKTVAINVTSEARVVVRAPQFLNKANITKIVKKKAPWIIKKQEYFKNLQLLYPEKEYISGEQILYLGRRYRLKVNKVQNSSACKPKVVGRRVIIHVNSQLSDKDRRSMIEKAIIQWYILRAENVINKRIQRYKQILGVNPKNIEIKDQRILRFNWRVAIAPMSIIDYIVVHELCHLKIKNHSKEFWRLVSLVLPDYQKRRNWLKQNVGIFRI
jgi:predicted metal-dependent hydrolase